ncbi:MAG: transposase family protein [Spirochaetaceae bacterium]|jgi:hypothetical protein|nr:transposase family protein [Spirochaetaceae bacterium]
MTVQLSVKTPRMAMARATAFTENDFELMEDWGREREEWFREFLELPNGIPDKDTFMRLFERLNPGELLSTLTRWLSPADVLFREDASQARKDKAPENLNILRKIALARLRATMVSEKRFSTKRKIFKASVNPEFLYSVLFGK